MQSAQISPRFFSIAASVGIEVPLKNRNEFDIMDISKKIDVVCAKSGKAREGVP